MSGSTSSPRSARGLRVLILGLNYAPELTGVGPYTTGLAEGLQQHGHKVRVLTSFPHYPHWSVPAGAPRTAVEEVRGVRVDRLRHYVPRHPTAGRRAASELAFGARLLTSRWGHPDVILCVSPALLATALAFVRAKVFHPGPALGLVVQDLYSSGVAETGTGGSTGRSAIRRIESAVGAAADGVVVIHDQFSASLQDLRVPPQRVKVIKNWSRLAAPLWFDHGEFRTSMGWQPGELVVLHAGAEGVKQGLENVVEAASLADRTRAEVRFVLLGDGSQRRSLEEMARGVRSIQFVDPLDEPAFAKALVASDVLLVNERPGVATMCVPSKLTSYFTAGKPVLAAVQSDSTTAMELARAHTGVVVDPRDPQGLLSAALELGAHPHRSAVLAAEGSRYAHEVLSAEAAIDTYDGWVRELVLRRRRKGSYP